MRDLRQDLSRNHRDHLYQKHAEEHEILEVLALLAEGNRISILTGVKGIKEDTILRWLREAARHADELEAILGDLQRKWTPCTPAMAASLTDHIRTVKELLFFVRLPSAKNTC